MRNSRLRAAILIVSDTAAKNPSTDGVEPVLKEVFDGDQDQWEVAATEIVPDNVLDIQRCIRQWADPGEDFMNLVVTAGGTGFAVNDVTPEAVSPLLHRHSSGIVHGMLSASLDITRFALMARPVAGLRNATLIITLPGSPKGSKENLQAVLELLPHACFQATGANSREIHSKGLKTLESNIGIQAKTDESLQASRQKPEFYDRQSHCHGNHGHHQSPVAHTNSRSNDPNAGTASRYRSSPYPMISVDDALELIKKYTPSPEPTKAFVNEALVGSVLAEDVRAPEAVPAFRASIVDGYAFCFPETKKFEKGVYPVSIVSHAQVSVVNKLEENQVARITTGAPLPLGASAVVMVEDTVIKEKTADSSEEIFVEILTDTIKCGENIREVGSDVRASEIIMREGEGISATGGELGLLASVGVTEVKVWRKPIVGVLSTGDELVQFDKMGSLELGQVRDTNRLTLLTIVRNSGFEVVDLGIASDKPEELEKSLRSALQQVDTLITTGGVSMGERDLLKSMVERVLGGTIHFGRVNMKPGKPTTFATVPCKHINSATSSLQTGHRLSKPVFSLPGNPASALVTFQLFVLPSLHQQARIRPLGLPTVSAILDQDLPIDGQRPEYHRALVVAKEGGRELHAMSTGGQRSSRIGSFKGANALLCMPAGKEPMRKGESIKAMLMGNNIFEI